MAENGVNELAQRLSELKEHSGRSYTALAGRAALSRSTVHRYCSGAAVPPDFDAVLRLARVCGAEHDELLDLHRLWVLATAVRPDPDPAPTADPAPAPTADPAPAPAGAPAPWWRLLLRPDPAAVLIVVVLLGLMAVGLTWPDAGTGAELRSGTPRPILLGPACAADLGLGDRGDCVRQVQALLREDGARLKANGIFTPETLRRVVAFQVLAGLPPTGRVDDATKRALTTGGVTMRTWSEERVERRIRQVFRSPGAGDEAVRIARCHSNLDPLWAERGWGVFRLSDGVLGRYDGTPQLALDPEWNIQAAHWIWAEHRDFRAWPACPAVSAGASPATSAPAATRSPRAPR